MNQNLIIFLSFSASLGYLYKETAYSTVAGLAVGLGCYLFIFFKSTYDEISKNKPIRKSFR